MREHSRRLTSCVVGLVFWCLVNRATVLFLGPTKRLLDFMPSGCCGVGPGLCCVGGLLQVQNTVSQPAPRGILRLQGHHDTDLGVWPQKDCVIWQLRRSQDSRNGTKSQEATALEFQRQLTKLRSEASRCAPHSSRVRCFVSCVKRFLARGRRPSDMLNFITFKSTHT